MFLRVGLGIYKFCVTPTRNIKSQVCTGPVFFVFCTRTLWTKHQTTDKPIEDARSVESFTHSLLQGLLTIQYCSQHTT